MGFLYALSAPPTHTHTLCPWLAITIASTSMRSICLVSTLIETGKAALLQLLHTLITILIIYTHTKEPAKNLFSERKKCTQRWTAWSATPRSKPSTSCLFLPGRSDLCHCSAKPLAELFPPFTWLRELGASALLPSSLLKIICGLCVFAQYRLAGCGYVTAHTPSGV